MKTYIAYQMLGRLSGHLIEFMASEEFMQRMYELDPMLKRIEFEIH